MLLEFTKYELGTAAVQLLLHRVAERERPAERVQLRSALAIRESCGALLQAPVA